MKKRCKKPWSTDKVMVQIYEQHLWGGKSFDFYSGSGSHNKYLVEPYIKVVKEFLKSFKNKPKVCDLGCGDFNIGKQLVPFAENYIAIDIVPKLIERNQQLFKADNLVFQCLDISKNYLPNADVVILRQVLQHLSNKEIKAILPKLEQYKYVILTEHIPDGDFIPNKDIISGQGIRLKKNSGISILDAPFNFEVKNIEEILRISNKEYNGVLVTWVVEN